jgi:hypothetical protein
MAAQQAEIWKRVGSVYDQDRFQRTCEIIETAMECAVPESLFLAFIARDIVSVRESIASTRVGWDDRRGTKLHTV